MWSWSWGWERWKTWCEYYFGLTKKVANRRKLRFSCYWHPNLVGFLLFTYFLLVFIVFLKRDSFSLTIGSNCWFWKTFLGIWYSGSSNLKLMKCRTKNLCFMMHLVQRLLVTNLSLPLRIGLNYEYDPHGLLLFFLDIVNFGRVLI